MRNPRVLVLPLLVLAAAGGLLLWSRRAEREGGGGGTGGPAGGGPPGANPLEELAGKGRWHEEPVRTRVVPRTERIPARVRAPERVVVRTPVRGAPVVEIPAREGMSVKKGDLLVRLASAPWEKELREAERAADEARIARAKEALAGVEIRAPADGLVYRVEARLGEMPPTFKGEPLPLVELFDWTRLRFEGTAPGSLADMVREDAPIFVRAGKDFLTPARLAGRDPPGPDGGFGIVAVPREPPGVAPEPDGEGEIHLVTGEREVLVVPAAALRPEGGRTVVFVASVTGELSMRHVVVGWPLKDRLFEVSGVERFEKVAVWE